MPTEHTCTQHHHTYYVTSSHILCHIIIVKLQCRQSIPAHNIMDMDMDMDTDMDMDMDTDMI